MAKKRRRGLIRLRFRKNDPAHNLLTAVQHWLKANGGSAVVLGGIDVIAMPFDPEHKFRIAVGCLGKRPLKPVSPST